MSNNFDANNTAVKICVFYVYDGKNVRKKDTDLKLFQHVLLKDTCTERLNTDKNME